MSLDVLPELQHVCVSSRPRTAQSILSHFLAESILAELPHVGPLQAVVVAAGVVHGVVLVLNVGQLGLGLVRDVVLLLVLRLVGEVEGWLGGGEGTGGAAAPAPLILLQSEIKEIEERRNVISPQQPLMLLIVCAGWNTKHVIVSSP